MAELTYRAAVAAGIAQEMGRDPSVVLIGEDVGAAGGVFKLTEGLFDEFGPKRVRDTPISEQAIIGAAMGAAMTGLRPDRGAHVLRLLRGDLGHGRQPDRQDALHDGRARSRCRSCIRTANGAGLRFGAQHSQSSRELGDGDPRAQGASRRPRPRT